MPESIRLRLMTEADLDFADSLRTIAGWNQTRGDWQRFLAHEPDGCFIAEFNGVPAGTATTTVYGTQMAWIGMILVHPDQRRHGIGKALMQHCVDYLKGRGVRCIKLDATPLGRKLYDTLGFREEYTLTRWETGGLPSKASTIEDRAKPWRSIDTMLVESIDAAAFGASRQKMLALTAKQSTVARLHLSTNYLVDGYGLLRPGMRASYIGPVVAALPESGVTLIKSLVSQVPNQPIYWDVPDQNIVATELAQKLGFSAQRQLIRMYLGENPMAGIPRNQFAIGAPEIG